MHIRQPATRKDAQPDQEDVLDPEAREPALLGEKGCEEAPRLGCMYTVPQTPAFPPGPPNQHPTHPAPESRDGLSFCLSPTSVHPLQGRDMCLMALRLLKHRQVRINFKIRATS